MKSLLIIIFLLLSFAIISTDNVESIKYLASSNFNQSVIPMLIDTVPSFPYKKTEAEWKQILTPSQYRILRKKRTEIPFINKYYDSEDDGIYVCAGCGQELYDSNHKYDSGTGWPSFWNPIADSLVVELEDRSLFMVRTEIVCSNCGGHLGHVFDDGPHPTGLRYCMNSVAMKFVPRDQIQESK